ncbi:MAG: hypothetical protein ACOYBX_13370 [Mycobacterium sp.]
MKPLVNDDGRILRGTELRYVLVRLIQLMEPVTIPELLGTLREWGFTVEGRPAKTVSDALRWEQRRDRVRRRGRGLYRAGCVPRGTEHRIITRVAALRKEALSLRGGQEDTSPGAGPMGRVGRMGHEYAD